MTIGQHMDRLKDRNHVIISTDTEKDLGKDQHPFMMKVLKKFRILGTHLNIIKAMCDKYGQYC